MILGRAEGRGNVFSRLLDGIMNQKFNSSASTILPYAMIRRGDIATLSYLSLLHCSFDDLIALHEVDDFLDIVVDAFKV